MDQKLRFAVFGNEYQTKKSASMALLLSCLHRRGAEVFVERTFYDFLKREENGERRVESELWEGVRVFDKLDFPADYAISMGGDGTLLKTASHVGNSGIPIIGVNTGRLGFLADFLPADIDEAFDEIYNGTCIVEEHAVIGIEEVERGERREERRKGYPYALNDIAVLKRDNASMITIHARINGNDLVTYQADGLVVSTPTGSTAYNLSNGGPIMAPLTGILCLTPVAPHSLNIRPIVINDDSVIDLTVESRTHNYLVAVDGRSASLDDRIQLVIRKAPHTVRIVKRASQHYFATLREKMMWGLDAR
ncbi:MAG: NAD kinase [Prevotella sp.]|nr:NAD kinase [Prevotella sp.]